MIGLKWIDHFSVSGSKKKVWVLLESGHEFVDDVKYSLLSPQSQIGFNYSKTTILQLIKLGDFSQNLSERFQSLLRFTTGKSFSNLFSLDERLNSHYESWSYKKKKQNMKIIKESRIERTQGKKVSINFRLKAI